MSGLLLGLISLIIFALLDTFASLNVALIALAVATIIECIYSVIVFGTLDSISLLSIALVIVLALLAYKQQSSLMIKLKPAILNDTIVIETCLKYAKNYSITIQQFAYRHCKMNKTKELLVSGDIQIVAINSNFKLKRINKILENPFFQNN